MKLVQGKKEKKKGKKRKDFGVTDQTETRWERKKRRHNLASPIKLKLAVRERKKKRQHNLASPIKSQFIRGEIRQQSFAVTTQSVNFKQKQNQKTLMPVFQVMVLYKKTTVRGRVRM